VNNLIKKYSPILILVVLLFVTYLVFKKSLAHYKAEYQSSFESKANLAMSAIQSKMLIYESILRGGEALFNASDFVSRNEWKKYVESVKLNKTWSGIQGMGYSQFFYSKEKKSHEQKIRKEKGFEDYKVHPLGSRESYSAIIYLEPLDWRNKRAIGYDMWSNEVRREAMSRARDTGEAATSGLITLVQETQADVQAGFLTYIPVYNRPASELKTIAEKRRSFMGWVYSPFRSSDLVSDIHITKKYGLEFQLYDEKDLVSEKLLHSSVVKPEDNLKSIKMGMITQGRTWTLVFYNKPFSVFKHKELLGLLLIGLVISLLVSYIFYVLNTLRNKAHELVEVKGTQLNIILESTGLGLWTYYPKEKKLIADESMYSLLEINRDEYKNHVEAWEGAIHPNDKGQLLAQLKKALTGEEVFDTKFRVITNEGKLKSIKSKAELSKNDMQEVIKITGFSWDISNEEEMKKKLEVQRRASYHREKLASIGELAAGVGHEVNNPLAIIDGYLDSLEKQVKKSDELDVKSIDSYLKKIRMASSRIYKIVNGLRTFSRSDSENINTFDVIQSLDESINMVAEIYSHSGIKITKKTKIAKNKISLIGNQGKLQQVFMNLLSNAKDALEGVTDKEITISTKLNNNKLEILFSDNGCGMSESIKNNIFDPFFTTKEVNKGTGIGLSLSHSIISEIEGKISLKSEVGVGTEFTLELPVIPYVEPEEKIAIPEKNYKFDKKDKFKVLLVDDEEDIREILSEMLADLELEVTTAENGKVAYNLILQNPNKFDLIITDMQMPEMTGPELLNNIRINEAIPKQPKIIFITGGVNVDFEDDKFSKQIDGHLYKPFTTKKLNEVLVDILGF